MGGWHKLTDHHFRSDLGDVKRTNPEHRRWTAYDSIGTEVGVADTESEAMELVRNSNLTKDLRILAHPNLIRARIKEDALVTADSIKAKLVSQSQSTRREVLTERLDNVSDSHLSMVKDEIRKWAKLQGYRATIDDKVIELSIPSVWYVKPFLVAYDIICAVGNSRATWKTIGFTAYLAGVLYIMYMISGGCNG